ncbi:type III secretion system chaperone [Rhizobium sp. FKL33]|uniref:type III secretion system chaperone n=1 Tax=Rhizobium sp. FKL33 TaxID=2562307 RepID=UPI0010C075EF|nr:type III secretion system chaperone [Rhizobium sp. FKL33]
MEEEQKTVLQVFCELNGIATPDTIEDDIISLDINEVSDIWLLYLGDGVTEIFAQLPGLDADDPGVMRLLLEANYLGIATDGARLAIDPVEGHVVLSERWGYERLLAEQGLEDLERFAALVHSWRNDGVAAIQAKMRGEEIEEEVEEFAASELLRV